MGDSFDRIRDFPEKARKAMGVQLFRIQNGLDRHDWKPMKTVGTGVRDTNSCKW